MRTVHVGFPKTATTFLQTRVFPLLADQLVYLDKQASSAFFRPLMSRDDTIYDGAALAAALESLCPRGRRALFSFEALTGLPHHCAFVNRSSIAHRLRELGFDRALITIRNQPDALESTYKQYVRSGGTMRLRDYLSFDDSRPRLFYPEYFDYYPIYRLYADLFGSNNVLVLQHERLREPSFLAALFDFLKVASIRPALDERVNESLSSRKTRVLRVLNYFPYRLSRKTSRATLDGLLMALPFGNGSSSMLDASLRDEIVAFFHERNRRLKAEAGIVLSPAYP